MAVSALAAIGSYAGGYAASTYVVAGSLLSYSGAMLATVAGRMIGGYIGAQIGAAIVGKPAQQASLAAESQARTQVIRSATANHTVVYGAALVSGPLVFAASTGSNNEYLHLVVAVAGHPLTRFDSVWLGEDEIDVADIDANGNPGGSKYSGHARFRFHLGEEDQAADADLVAEVPEWTAAHRLRGVAYIYVRLHFSADVFPSGLPNIKASVYRHLGAPSPDYGGVTGANWALAVRDYLASASYGLGCGADEIDEASFITAAHVSDEFAYRPGSGAADYRYTCNGAFDSGARPLDILNRLLSAGAGALTYSQGKYRLTAGAWINPATTLTADDLRGPLSVRPRVARSSLFNGVRGTYTDPSRSWQTTDFPVQVDAAYRAQDGDVEILTDIELPYTANPYTAQRIARQHLNRARQGISVDFPGKLTCAHIPMMDIILLDMPVMGWSQKPFRVLGWSLASDGTGVDLSLQEEAESSYEWNTTTIVDDAPDTSLKLYPEIVSYTVTESLVVAAGAVVPKLHVELVTKGVFRKVYVTVKQSGYPDQGLNFSQREFDILLPEGGPLQLIVAPIGLVSNQQILINVNVIGKLAPPADVSGLSFNAHGDSVTLTWQPATDLDVIVGGYMVVRYVYKINPKWDEGVDVLTAPGAATSAVLQAPFSAGSWMARWMDSSGNLSTATALAWFGPGLVPAQRWAKLVADHEEFPTWSGIQTGLVPLGSGLTLDGVSTTGTYRTPVHDIGVVRQARCYADVDFTTYTNAPMDSIVFAIDDWPDVDGGSLPDVAVSTWVRTTPDDPFPGAGSPAWSDWQQFAVATDITGRAFQIELRTGTTDPTRSLWLTGLSWGARLQSRVTAAVDVASSTSGTTITYPEPFYEAPLVFITGAAGEHLATLSNRTAAGFTVNFHDYQGTPTAPVFDWLANGH